MKKVLTIGFLTFIAILLIIYFQSCKRDSLDDTIAPSYSYTNDTLFAPVSVAFEIAENVNKSDVVLKTIDKQSLKSARYQGKRKIKNNLIISDKENKTPYFYVLNYESGGYSIISADKRVTPIIGYSENSSFSMDSIPLGLLNWFEASASYMKHLRTSNAKQSEAIMYQWAYLGCDNPLAKSSPDLKSSTYLPQCPPPTPPESSETTVIVGPLLTTKWDQGCGYNTYCPVLSSAPSYLCGHAWTGCSTTAVAQVMAYWKYPADYSWSTMSTYASDAVAVLMGDIFPNTIDSYDAGGSSCKNDYNIRHTFVNRFGYSSASLAGWVNGIVENGGYSYQKVVSSLCAKQPVILGGYSSYRNILGLYSYPTGSGHTWICDGFRQTTMYQNGIETAQYLFFDMNWGWSGRYNGFYYFDDWSSPGGSYNYFADMIYNIHP